MKNIYSKLLSIALLLFVVVLFSSDSRAQNKKDMKKAQGIVKVAERSFNKKDYQEAINKYAEAISLVNNFPYAHFWKGYAHYYLKEYENALREINLANDQGFTPRIDLVKLRWYLNYVTKNYDAAISDLNEGLIAEPTNLALKAGLGDVNYAKGAFREALNVYVDIVEKIPNNGDTYYAMADSYYRLGETENQRLAADKASKNGTNFMSESYFLIGEAFQKNRKYIEAADAYDRSINVKKDNYDTYRRLSDVYRNLNRFADAIKVTKAGLLVFERDGNLYTDLAWFYSLADQHTDAVGAAQIAVSLLPNVYQGHTYLCRALNDTKDYPKAIAACNEALRLNPEDGETNFYLGRAYELTGKPDLAKKNFQKAVVGLVEYTKKYPDFADGYYLLGNAYFQTGQNAKAIQSYLKSLEFSPTFKKARYNLGYVYIQIGDIASATAQYEALLAIDKVVAGKLKEELPKK